MRTFQKKYTVLMLLLKVNFVFSQLYFGFSGGVQIPGHQDLKFKNYINGSVFEEIRTSETVSRSGSILNINALYFWEKYGLRLDYYDWSHTTLALEFKIDNSPPFRRIEQERQATLISVMKKLHPFKKLYPKNDSNAQYSYIGAGVGIAYTEVEQGRTNLDGSFQILGGHSLRLVNRFRITFEFKLILTRDADTRPENSEGWRVDTSGTWHLFRFGPHWDTKYHVFQIGLHYKLF